MNRETKSIWFIVIAILLFTIRYAPIVPYSIDLGFISTESDTNVAHISLAQADNICSKGVALLATEKCGWAEFTNVLAIVVASILFLFGLYYIIIQEIKKHNTPTTTYKNKKIDEEFDDFDDDNWEYFKNIFPYILLGILLIALIVALVLIKLKTP